MTSSTRGSAGTTEQAPAGGRAGADPDGVQARLGAAGALAHLGDWLNPILVKEVRQALRGRYFKICFWVTVLAVSIVTTGMLISGIDDGKLVGNEGRDFLFGVYVCLTVAVLGLVPFSAFNAMGAEWDENTFDLLVISNLRPRSIVLGKLLSTSVQGLLFYSAFTPYLVFSSLLQRVDLLAVLTLIAGTLFLSTALSILALCLSTLSRVRFARIVLMAALAGALVWACAGAAGLGHGVIMNPGLLRSPDAQLVMAVAGFVVAILSAYGFVVASVMLSHPEENRSTPLRALTTASILAALLALDRLTVFKDPEAISGATIGLIVALLVPATFLVTEPESLGRRVAPRVPRNPLLAWLALPFLPGGARGFVHFLLGLALLVVGSFWVKLSMGVRFDQLHEDGGLAVLAAMLYAVAYLGLPSALIAPFAARPTFRIAARVSVPFLIAAFAFVPAVFGWFVGDRGLQNMRHPGNPFRLIERAWEGKPTEPGVWVLLLALTALALLLNLRRVLVGADEVQRASRQRRARERAFGAHERGLAGS